MIVRSCLCFTRKYYVSSQQQPKKTISLYIKNNNTHLKKNNSNIKSVFTKYPGLLLHYPHYQQKRLFTIAINPISNQSNTASSTVPSCPLIHDSRINADLTYQLDLALNNQLNIKQAETFYRQLSKLPALSIYNLLTENLSATRYKRKAQKTFKEASAYWSSEMIQQITSACGDDFKFWQLDLLDALLARYVFDKKIDPLILILPTHGDSFTVLPFYNAVLSKCLKQKQYNHIEQVINLMSERNIRLDTATFNILIRMRFERASLTPEQAKDIYSAMLKQDIEPNAATFNTLIKFACENEQWSSMKEWLDEMDARSIDTNRVTARIIFKHFITHYSDKDLSDALERVTSVLPTIDMERFLATGAAKFIKDNDTTSAMNLLSRVFDLNLPLSVYSYNLLLKALCLDGKINQAQDVLAAMVTPPRNSKKSKNIPKPDIVSFTTVIHGVVRHSDQVELDEINKIYQQCLDQGIRTNNTLQSVLLYGVAKSKNNSQLSKTQSMFESVLLHKDDELLPRKKKSAQDVPLDEIRVYNIMMDFYFLYYHKMAKKKFGSGSMPPKEPFLLLDEALEKKLKPSVVTMNIMVRGLAILNKDLNAAEKMVKAFENRGVRTDEKTVWYLAISAYKSGQITRARDFITDYEKRVGGKDKNVINGTGLKHLKSILNKWDENKDDTATMTTV